MILRINFSNQVLTDSHDFRFRCVCLIFKFCQTVASICITSQFHEFLDLVSGGILVLSWKVVYLMHSQGARVVFKRAPTAIKVSIFSLPEIDEGLSINFARKLQTNY